MQNEPEKNDAGHGTVEARDFGLKLERYIGLEFFLKPWIEPVGGGDGRYGKQRDADRIDRSWPTVHVFELIFLAGLGARDVLT